MDSKRILSNTGLSDDDDFAEFYVNIKYPKKNPDFSQTFGVDAKKGTMSRDFHGVGVVKNYAESGIAIKYLPESK